MNILIFLLHLPHIVPEATFTAPSYRLPSPPARNHHPSLLLSSALPLFFLLHFGASHRL